MEHTEANKTKVFLADDHTLFRAGIASILAKANDMEVVGQAETGLGLIERVLTSKADVLVLDICMPGLNGLDVCHQLTEMRASVQVLVVTMYGKERFVTEAMENGAAGYLSKDVAPSRFCEAVRTIARGGVYLGPNVPKTALAQMNRNRHDPYGSLTGRERQVLQLVAEGLTNRQVAEDLCISHRTVETHRSRLMQKLDLHSEADILRYALERGIIEI